MTIYDELTTATATYRYARTKATEQERLFEMGLATGEEVRHWQHQESDASGALQLLQRRVRLLEEFRPWSETIAERSANKG